MGKRDKCLGVGWREGEGFAPFSFLKKDWEDSNYLRWDGAYVGM
jgi:hypothetical protein